MEILFLILLVLLMAFALASGYPVAFALPGSAILSILIAAVCGYLFDGDVKAYFHGSSGPIEWLNSGVSNFRTIYWVAERDTLIAIPLFVFMGIMLERSKIAEDLLMTMAQLFGRIPGGLGVSVVFVGALLAATTGILGATVVAMGLISLPVMLRNGYSPALATGTISASGTLGQIIPPSIVLIILADQLSNATDQGLALRQAEFKLGNISGAMPSEYGLTSASAGDMFLGAFFPGLVLVGLYAAFILAIAFLRKGVAPPIPREGKLDLAFARRTILVLVPPLALIFAVLGSILMGIATVNQAGAIGATGAMIMAGYRLKQGTRGAFYPAILALASIIAIFFLLSNFTINVKNIATGEDELAVTLAAIAVIVLLISLVWSGWRVFKIDETLRYVVVETTKTTALVFIILIGAAMLTAAFRAFGGEDLVRDFLFGLPGGFLAKFALVMAVIFFLGFFLDFIEIAVVVVPIVAPILLADPSANITAVWLGVMIGVNMQTSFLTPPFGFALFYLRGVAPAAVKTTDMYKGVVPFISLQLLALVIVGLYPTLVNYLPNRISLTGETAPPPRNPRLQRCIEARNFVIYDRDGKTIRAAITKMEKTDISYLPDERQGELKGALKNARRSFSRIAAIRKAEVALKAHIPSYEPIHRRVRFQQRQMKTIDKKLEDLKSNLQRATRAGAAGAVEKATTEKSIAELTAKRAELAKNIPKDWRRTRRNYVTLAKRERLARLIYRRTVDNAYEPILEFRKLMASADGMKKLQPDMDSIRAIATGDKPAKERMLALRVIERKLRKVAGTSSIQSRLSAIRRELRRKEPRMERINKALEEALKRFATEVKWREVAKARLTKPLQEYDNVIKHTIGLRLQVHLPADQVGDVATCLSHHRDISLDF
jgi:tripartite ATP-independent transporter DctM subunit